jgi:hypothetical protein
LPTAEDLKPIKALCQEVTKEQNPARFAELVNKLSDMLEGRAAGR